MTHWQEGSGSRVSPLVSRLRGALPPLALFALALAVRALPWRDVFTSSGTVLGGFDPFFHMRRIAWSIAHFPAVQDFDPYIQFPQGARPISAPLFDWAIAALAKPWVGAIEAGGVERLERIAVWVPPVLGALTVVAAWALAKRHFGAAAAGASGILLALLSGHYWYSRIGIVDHHAAVALLATLELACALALLAAHRDGNARAAQLWAAGLGLVTSALFLVWPGSLLFLALLDGPLLLVVLRDPERRSAQRLALQLAGAHALAAAVVFPWSWGNEWPHLGPFAPVVLSEFQPWALASVAASLALAAAAWSHARLGATRLARGTGLLGIALALLLTSLLLLPGTAGALDLLLAWLSRSEQFSFYQRVREAQPIFSVAGGFSLDLPLQRLSAFSAVFPLAVAWLAWSSRNDRSRALMWTLLFWASGLCLMTLLQRRFFNTFSVGLALVTGVALHRSFQWLVPRLPGRRRALAAAIVAVVAVGAMLPTLKAYTAHLHNQLGALRGQPARRAPNEAARHRQVRLARWLRAATPSPGEWLARDAQPAYGILAPSDLGHLLKYVAQRPVVVDNFVDDVGGDGYDFYVKTFSSEEAEAYRALVERRVRYLVTASQASMLRSQFPPEGLFHVLGAIGDPALEKATDAASAEMPSHFRLLYEALARPQGSRRRVATLRVYEVVTGARLVGNAAPGSEVTVTLALRTGQGRQLEYSRRRQVDATGQWTLRVPYATQGAPTSSVRPHPSYRLSCNDAVVGVRIDEESVQSGDDVAVACAPQAAEPDPRGFIRRH